MFSFGVVMDVLLGLFNTNIQEEGAVFRHGVERLLYRYLLGVWGLRIHDYSLIRAGNYPTPSAFGMSRSEPQPLQGRQWVLTPLVFYPEIAFVS
jgi:hypothetical protein